MGVSSCSLTHDRMTRRSLHRSYGVAFSRGVRELFVPKRCSPRIRLVSLGLNKRSDRNLACWRYFRDWERTRSFHFLSRLACTLRKFFGEHVWLGCGLHRLVRLIKLQII